MLWPRCSNNNSNMTKRIFYKTVFKIEVLSEGPIDGLSIEDIAYEIDQGSCVGGPFGPSKCKKLDGKQAADALYEWGSEPGFFGLNDRGGDTR